MGIGVEVVAELTTTGTMRGLARVDDVDLAGAGNMDASFRPGDETVVRDLGGIVFGRIAGKGRDNLETDTDLPSWPALGREILSTFRVVPGDDCKTIEIN